MLVLSRKLNERIHIGDDIVVTVVRTGRGQIRLGIEAPSDIKILREELLHLESAGPVGSDETDDDNVEASEEREWSPAARTSETAGRPARD